MTQSEHPANRTFQCEHCQGKIEIPYDLPPTSAPCPHCEGMTTSPALPAVEAVSPSPTTPPAGTTPVPSYGMNPSQMVPREGGGGMSGLDAPLTPLAETPTPESLNLDPLVAAPAAPVMNPLAQPVVADPGPVPAELIQAPEPEPEPSVLDIAAPAVPQQPTPVPEPQPAPVPESQPVPAPDPQPAPQPDPVVGAGGAAMLDDDDLRDEIAAVGRPVVEPKSGGGVPNVLIVFLGLVLLIAGLVILGLYLLRSKERGEVEPTVDRVLVERNRYLREGWKSESTEQLRGFLEAETVEERANYVLHGEQNLEQMRQFYAGGGVEGADTPLAAFSHFDLQLADRERGLFLMRYERPAQFNMREFFRPVAPLEVQYDVAEPGLLLTSFAMLENFATDPVRVMAFFKKEGGTMKLDWDVFVQTKYRMLKSFSSYPQPGQRRTFRVILEEDLSILRDANPQTERYYRLSDPANSDDHVKVPVAVNSELGQTLAVVNWVGLVVDEKPSRTATIVLEWTTDREPQLRMSAIVCWEFVDLGGEPGNAKPVPVAPTAPDPVSAPPEETPPIVPAAPRSTGPNAPGTPDTPPSVPPGVTADPVPPAGWGPQ